MQREDLGLQRNMEIYQATKTEDSRRAMDLHRVSAQASLEAVEAAFASLSTLRSRMLLVSESISSLQEEVLRSKLEAVGPSLESLSLMRKSIAEARERILLKESATREITAESDKTNAAIKKFAMETSVDRTAFLQAQAGPGAT